MGFSTPGMVIEDPDLVSSHAVEAGQCIEIGHYSKLQFKTLFGALWNWNSQMSILTNS